MIYLDHGATTKPDSSVLQTFNEVSETYFANPSSLHELGGTVAQLQRRARKQIAQLLHVEENEVVFTSGGTEGNNLAIKGIALQHANRGKHMITTQIEHASVYETCKAMEGLGYEVTYLPVNKEGVVSIEDLEKALREDTILVSIMHVNNEIGTVQPIEKIGQLLEKHPKVFFHVDGVQGLGKVPLSLKEAKIDLCTFSGHKINGLKGTGIIYVKQGTELFPLLHGGEQEFGLRSGTENVPGNVSFARALRIIKEKEKNHLSALIQLRKMLIEQLDQIETIQVNSPKDGAPHVVHISAKGLKPEVAIHALYEKGLVLSTQSACSSKRLTPSRILRACGYDEERSSTGLRITMSYDTTKEEILLFTKELAKVLNELKGIMG